MKQMFAVVLMLVLLCGTACLAESGADLTCADIAGTVLASAEFRELTDMTQRYMEKHLSMSMDISAEDFDDWIMKRDATRATPEMILILKVKDGVDQAAIKRNLQEFNDEQLLEYRDYQPTQVFKLENARPLENGAYLALIVSPDPQASVTALGADWH